MRTTKTRHQFYLPDALSAKLDALADVSGGSKTAILTDALTAWFERGAAAEVDQHFGPRFDRLARVQTRVEDKVDILSETLAVFIRHQVTLATHQPPLDHATRQLGSARYEALLTAIAQQLATRKGGDRLREQLERKAYGEETGGGVGDVVASARRSHRHRPDR